MPNLAACDSYFRGSMGEAVGNNLFLMLRYYISVIFCMATIPAPLNPACINKGYAGRDKHAPFKSVVNLMVTDAKSL